MLFNGWRPLTFLLQVDFRNKSLSQTICKISQVPEIKTAEIRAECTQSTNIQGERVQSEVAEHFSIL